MATKIRTKISKERMTTLEYLNWYDKIREEYSFYIYTVHVLHFHLCYLDYRLSLMAKIEMIDIINPHRPVDFKRLEKPHKRMLLFGKDLWLEEV